ncbi:MAG TPA: NADH-quinone oxidoreductase subunit C [Dermatophilaceae bacterium]|nr:NADH-quinone oxidoreductase subunit C [Dermatophilaceae bacterium]
MKALEVPCRDVPVDGWLDALTAARDEGFSFFDWLTAVDQTDAADSGGTPGFDVVAHLLDPASRGDLQRVLLRTRVPVGGSVASATGLWRGAAWHERETHEMFGVAFDGFDDGTGQGLRPLLLPDGFEGTPLRKSFVLAARASKPWPGAKEPGESGHDLPERGGRRRMTPPGVPDPDWGPR